MLSKIQPRYQALLALCLWGGALLFFNLVRLDPYGIDEGAALALLVNWSVADQIINPIVAFGMPDFRALLFMPLGLYWPGSILAAKVFTIIIAFFAAMQLYYWSKQSDNDEVALLGTGLLLIAPLMIMQIDQIGGGIYLLFMLGLGSKVDEKQRAAERSIGNWYFIHMLLIAVIVSLHPIGLAYPVALAIRWIQEPIDKKRQRYNFIGIGITVFIVLIMQAGWLDLAWFNNPFKTFAVAFSGIDISQSQEPSIFYGFVPLALLALILIYDWRHLSTSTLGLSMLIATVAGLFIADQAWAMIALALFIYRGIHYLIKINTAIKAQNFVGQRGLVLFIIFVVATIFMQIDKSYVDQIANNELSPEDSLFRTLVLETENADSSITIASQWPARTMIAVKHAVLPLPPAAENGEAFLKMIKGITYIMFSHNDINNYGLTRNIAEVSQQFKTLAVQQGGVIVKLRENSSNPGIDSSGIDNGPDKAANTAVENKPDQR
ncbi:MAG: hypothetical protein GXP19_07725 [Gammaproteobacteria bacterium]|nr:hypothetical protein [Gammaproteobacteria bacterium]